MRGYNPDFLDNIHLPLPDFSARLAGEIHRSADLDEQVIAHYPNYSVITNAHTDKRSAVVAALNIDQNQYRRTHRSDRWRTDSRIGEENQLNNDYYRNNPWDRGHLARRDNAAWGADEREAQIASDETFYYSNASLQHQNLNQDEWLALEDWVRDLDIVKGGKISSFSGPFYAAHDRSITPEGRPLALVPAGFFKVVCFINKDSDALDVRAFVIYQDEEALRDRAGRQRYNNLTYQSTITEVEALTGLLFDSRIYHANPLFAHIDSAARDGHGETITPERFEVAKSEDLMARETPRPVIRDDLVDIYIAGALPNPAGDDRFGEWIVLMNLGAEPVSVANWTLEDNSGQRLEVPPALLEAGETLKVGPLLPLKLGNSGDVIKLFNAAGERIDWVNYLSHMVQPGRPVWFLASRDILR